MEFRSAGMWKFLGNIDDYILQLEEEVEFLKNENEKLKKEKYERIDRDFQSSMSNIGNTLNAILGTPKIDVISAVVLDKIRKTEDIKEVHKYIEEIFKQNKEGVL